MTDEPLVVDPVKGGKRDFDFVVFGATGLTGRLVVEQMADVDRLLRRADGARR